MSALTPTELAVWDAITGRDGGYISTEEISRAVYGYADASSRLTIRCHVSNIRAKVGSGVIRTERGHGYRLALARRRVA